MATLFELISLKIGLCLNFPVWVGLYCSDDLFIDVVILEVILKVSTVVALYVIFVFFLDVVLSVVLM